SKRASLEGAGAVDHVREPIGGVVLTEVVHVDPAHLGGVTARLEPAAHGLGDVVDDHVVIADGGLLAHDAIDDPAEAEEAHAQSRLFLDLAHEGVLDTLAEMHEAARDAPLALPRRVAPPRE